MRYFKTSACFFWKSDLNDPQFARYEMHNDKWQFIRGDRDFFNAPEIIDNEDMALYILQGAVVRNEYIVFITEDSTILRYRNIEKDHWLIMSVSNPEPYGLEDQLTTKQLNEFIKNCEEING